MHRRRFLIAASTAAIASSLTRAADGSDTGVFERAEPAGTSNESQRVFYHRPPGWPADGRVVMVLHGVARNASSYRDAWISSADRYGFLLICPEFSRAKFPAEAWYNQGGLRATPDRTLWSFAVPDRVFADTRQRFGATASSYGLYGHSAGSQFVHRMLLLAPSARVDRIIAANAGYYTWPVSDIAYPYGLGGTDLQEAQIARFLTWPLVLLLGEADTNPDHPALLRNAEADKQGIQRFERGINFLAAGKREAARRGIALGWRVATVPGAGHSNRRMAPSAAAQLFS